MPAHKRKPNYNGATTMQELMTAVCDYYGDPVDDRKSEDLDHVSLHDPCFVAVACIFICK
jgi:hypothetical protein